MDGGDRGGRSRDGRTLVAETWHCVDSQVDSSGTDVTLSLAVPMMMNISTGNVSLATHSEKAPFKVMKNSLLPSAWSVYRQPPSNYIPLQIKEC